MPKLYNYSSAAIQKLTCSFWPQGLCAQFSLLLDTPSPWKFVNTFQAALFAHVISEGQATKFQLVHHEKTFDNTYHTAVCIISRYKISSLLLEVVEKTAVAHEGHHNCRATTSIQTYSN